MQIPLCGFANRKDVHDVCNIDRMHQSNLGAPQTIANGLEVLLSERKLLSQINEYLKQLPPFPGLNLPSFRLDQKSKCGATETADLKVLALAVLAVPAVAKQFAGPISGKLRHGEC